MSLVAWSTGAISIHGTQPVVLATVGIEIELRMSTRGDETTTRVHAINQMPRTELLEDTEFSRRFQTADCGIVRFTLRFNDIDFPCPIVKSRHDALACELIQSACVGKSARRAYLEQIIGLKLIE